MQKIHNNNYDTTIYNMDHIEFKNQITMIQTKINENFKNHTFDKKYISDILVVIVDEILNAISNVKFDEFKMEFKPFKFNSIEINESYAETKRNFGTIYDDDSSGIKTELLICKKMIQNKDIENIIISHCRFMNKLFSCEYNKKTFMQLHKLNKQLNNALEYI